MLTGKFFGIVLNCSMKKVFVNGCFDLLHKGHIELLNYAKNQGDYLLVGLDSDERIKSKKGYDRPINNINNRLVVLSNLKSVDQVEVFDSDSELSDLVKKYEPDIMIVGSDWKGQTVIGSEYAKSIIFFDRIENESTTNIIENYINRRHLR